MRVPKGDADIVLTEEMRRELRDASESAKRGESVDMNAVLAEAADSFFVPEAFEEELAQAIKEADTEEGVSVEEFFARLPARRRGR